MPAALPRDDSRSKGPVVAALGALLVVAVGVVFFLPQWVEEQAASPEPVTEAPTDPVEIEPAGPTFTPEQLEQLREEAEALLAELRPVMFDPNVDARMVDRSTGQDPVVSSAVNFYLGVTHDEVEAYYEAIRDPNDDTPVWYGLNSRLAKVEP